MLLFQLGNTAIRDTVIGYLSVEDPDNVIRDVQSHTCDVVQAEDYFITDQATMALKLDNPLPVDLESYDITIRYLV